MRAALLLLAFTVGCGTAATSAARRGDTPGLARAIEARHKAGEMSDGEAATIARYVLENELAKASPAEIAARVREVRSCARQLEGPLGQRASTHDAGGAEAAIALLDAGAWDAGSARRYLGDREDAWRAVGARSLVRREDKGARLAAMLDPAPAVRRVAMRASLGAKDPGDLDALFDAARRDPEPMVRSEAVRAISNVVDEASAPLAVTRLKDLWSATADDALREDIANAWAMPVLAKGGGAEALRVLLAADHGPGPISGAAAVLRAPEASFPRETRASALALLIRALEGPRRDQMFALAVLPLGDPDALAVLRKAAKSPNDLELRFGALARLVDSAPDRDASIAELEAFASPLATERMGTRARMVLAAARHTKIQAWVEKDLASADPRVRALAGGALVAMGKGARSAPLLADEDVTVRTRAACALLR